MKQCLKCKVEKDVEEFYKLARNRDGLHHWCKPCCKANAKRYYDPEKNRKQCKRWYERNKESANRKNREIYWTNRGKILEERRRYYLENRESIKEAHLKWYLKSRKNEGYRIVQNRAARKHNKKRRRGAPACARYAVYHAIKCGLLLRGPCSTCGTTEDVQAHHHMGYDLQNWFNVVWLCKKHHAEIHGKVWHG